MVVVAQSGVSTSYLRMTPTTLPASCRQGDIRVDSTNFYVQLCNGSNTWGAIPPGSVAGIGTFDTQSKSANGLVISGGSIFAQSEDSTHPGMVNNSAQTFSGAKTFSSTIVGSVNGNAATVTTNANLTGPITSSGNATSIAAQTGTGSIFAMSVSPSLTTPALGTPTALVCTNCTGTAPGLTAGTVTTNANSTGDVTSSGNTTTYAGTLPASKGGTGVVSPTTGSVYIGAGSSPMTAVAPGTSGNVLESNGTTWTSVASGTITPAGVVARNYLLNGGFDFWTRAVSFTISGSAQANTADRWVVTGNNAGDVVTVTQTTGVQLGSKFGLQAKYTTAPSSAANFGPFVAQFAETAVSYPSLYNTPLSGSAYVKSLGNVTQVSLSVTYNTTQTSAISSSAQVAPVTCAVNSSTFTLCSFTNQTTSTTPTSSGAIGMLVVGSGVSSGHVTDLNNGIIVEQAMLNTGATAANFARAGANYGAELLMTERFVEPLSGRFYGTATSTTLCEVALAFLVQKIGTPTITVAASGVVNIRENGTDKSSGNPPTLANPQCDNVSCWFQITNFSGLTTTALCADRANNSPWGYADADF